jgi:hypothetical protein
LTRPGRGAAALALGSLLTAFTALAGFYAWVLLNHDYEAEYLALGKLLLSGEIALYQDEMTGQWVPLPFVVYGLTQLGQPTLLGARMLSIVLTAAVIALSFRIGTAWRGPLAGTLAVALFVTHGLVMGYFVTVDFSPLVALLHLIGITFLFATSAPWRRLAAMAAFSLLFLVKPHYWPTIPFALAYTGWHARSTRERLGLLAITVAVPAAFFAADARHVKILAYVPVAREWVAPLGYYSWHTLIEDPSDVWVSEYADISWETSPSARLVQYLKSLGFVLKRYALWAALGSWLAALAVWLRARGQWRHDSSPPGTAFTWTLFLYLVAWQFVIVGPYVKQAFAYVGAVAPLAAVVLGLGFAAVWQHAAGAPTVRLAAVAGACIAVAASPWVHRQHTLPRRVSLEEAAIPTLARAAERIAAVIPADEQRVFLLGDPLPVHLAGRRTFLRQFHQHNMVLTSTADRAKYIRSGMWGAAEIESWLGGEARYAIIQRGVREFYRARKPYRPLVDRMDTLLAEEFELVEIVARHGDDAYLLYRRRGIHSAQRISRGPYRTGDLAC